MLSSQITTKYTLKDWLFYGLSLIIFTGFTHFCLFVLDFITFLKQVSEQGTYTFSEQNIKTISYGIASSPLATGRGWKGKIAMDSKSPWIPNLQVTLKIKNMWMKQLSMLHPHD